MKKKFNDNLNHHSFKILENEVAFSGLESSLKATQQSSHRMHMTSDLNLFGDVTTHAQFQLMTKQNNFNNC